MSADKRRKKVNRYKQQEIKVVLGGFLAVLIITLVLGYAITSGRTPEKVDSPTEKQNVQTTDNSSQKEKKTSEKTDENEEKITEEKTSEKQEQAQKDKKEKKAKVDENSSPFNPEEITVSDEGWELTLLDTEHKLPEHYTVKLAPAVSGSGETLDRRVQPFYEKMYNAAKKENVLLTPYSGYRNYASQERLFKNKVNSFKSQGLSNYEAEQKAAKVCQLPGCCENNLGIAMDILCNTNGDFKDTPQYAWLTKHAAEYGFIERYPEGKEDIAGVSAEPWHWRYVGAENAKKMAENGLCLEEYLNS